VVVLRLGRYGARAIARALRTVTIAAAERVTLALGDRNPCKPTQQAGLFRATTRERLVSAEEVLFRQGAAELFAQAVLVGVTGLGLLYFQPRRLASAIPGVEIHAQILEQSSTAATAPADAAAWAKQRARLYGLLLVCWCRA